MRKTKDHITLIRMSHVEAEPGKRTAWTTNIIMKIGHAWDQGHLHRGGHDMGMHKGFKVVIRFHEHPHTNYHGTQRPHIDPLCFFQEGIVLLLWNMW